MLGRVEEVSVFSGRGSSGREVGTFCERDEDAEEQERYLPVGGAFALVRADVFLVLEARVPRTVPSPTIASSRDRSGTHRGCCGSASKASSFRVLRRRANCHLRKSREVLKDVESKKASDRCFLLGMTCGRSLVLWGREVGGRGFDVLQWKGEATSVLSLCVWCRVFFVRSVIPKTSLYFLSADPWSGSYGRLCSIAISRGSRKSKF